MENLTKCYKKTPSPEQIFHYIYAVLYSNIYRKKYGEFLKIDFPKIPFTEDYKIFDKMAKYGEKLVNLHLLESTEIGSASVRFQGKGSDKVEKVKYEKGRVFINKDQYFEVVEPEVWQYQMGGYQVCAKWLKDRKDRQLRVEDTKHYGNIVSVLKKTIKIQKEVDEIYPKVEAKTIYPAS